MATKENGHGHKTQTKHYKSTGAFCCYGNQTKRYITKILAFLE